MENKTDELVQQLFGVVQTKKAEIAKALKPNWETNCVFKTNPDSSASVNLQVCSSLDELISILGFLCEKRNSFKEAQEILGTNLNFKWSGFSFDAWVSDIKTRINKIEITTKKRELEDLENRLDKLISPELKAKLELLEIQKILNK